MRTKSRSPYPKTLSKIARAGKLKPAPPWGENGKTERKHDQGRFTNNKSFKHNIKTCVFALGNYRGRGSQPSTSSKKEGKKGSKGTHHNQKKTQWKD